MALVALRPRLAHHRLTACSEFKGTFDMGHALTNSAACDTASAMALEQAALGDGAEVLELRRKAWNSYDLTYVVHGVDGTRKEVVVTNNALKRRLAATSSA